MASKLTFQIRIIFLRGERKGDGNISLHAFGKIEHWLEEVLQPNRLSSGREGRLIAILLNQCRITPLPTLLTVHFQ